MKKLIKISVLSFLLLMICCLNETIADNQKPLSPIENSFLAESKEVLRQFGYNIFETAVGFVAPSNIPVPEDYLLGPGDEVVINLWGPFEKEYRETIDRDGNLFLSELGKISAGRKTFSEVRKNLKERLNRCYKNTLIDIGLGKVRTIKIFVIGEVKRPGSYQVSGLSNLLQALYLAGGPTKNGSLRKIIVLRKGKRETSFDLYPFLLSGDTESVTRAMADGDTIFVPPIGLVVAICGEVKRPAIYELKEKTSLKDLIDVAGGFLPSASLERIQIERIENFRKKILLDVKPKNNLFLKDNDLIRVFSIEKRIRNSLSLEGMVKHPGDYQLKPSMRLNDILTPEGLLPEASLSQAEVIRLKNDGSIEIIEFSPEKLFKGDKKENIVLKSWDRIIIRSTWEQVSRVRVKGEVKFPGQYIIRAGERCSSLIQRTGGYTTRAFLPGAVFTRESVKRKEEVNLEKFIQRQATLLEKEKKGATDDEEQLIAEGEVLLKELSDKIPLGRIVFCLDRLQEFKGSSDDIILEDGDTLYIPKTPAAVSILGEVNNAGAICYQEGKKLNYYLKKVGGFTKNADGKYLYVIKPDGTATTKSLLIGRGDVIIVPQRMRSKTGKIIKDIVHMLYEVSASVSLF